MRRRVIVNDRMQQDYVYYRTEPWAAGRATMRQIWRWRAIARHVAAIRKHCERGDVHCRRRQRKAVLHWAYDSRAI